MKKTKKDKELESIKNALTQMKTIQNLMEADLEKYKIQGNVKAVKKLQSEIEKLEVNILELEEKKKILIIERNDKA